MSLKQQASHVDFFNGTVILSTAHPLQPLPACALAASRPFTTDLRYSIVTGMIPLTGTEPPAAATVPTRWL